ncbi:hypothetical protein G7Z17_g893 [Cylindrodendrum hubeiense]|uniref:NACHT domain-containing protein n=1 Tax=Cylindrodendrum hubeiense TaxID=595255 RepID=A0A9P5HNR8_9HYPO|nr:hypothetical protein G7Z17_g893 [Cylindrodendrum hubeiense]
MADPLSTAASIIAVVQLSTQIVGYIVGVTGATKERRRLREEIIACESILLQIHDHCDESEGETQWWEKIMALEGQSTPLYRLSVTMNVIKTKLEPRKGSRKALSSLKWPFDEKEIDQLISAIQREKRLLQLALKKECRDLAKSIKESSDENGKLPVQLIQTMKGKSTGDEKQAAKLEATRSKLHLSQDNMRDDVVELRGYKLDWEQQAILDWITTINYAPQQSDFISRRQAGTGQWILNSTEFNTWIGGDNQTLFCPGIPGAGKTMLTATTVDHLTRLFRHDPDVKIIYIYFNFRRNDEQKVVDLLACVLKQLSQGRGSLPDAILTAIYCAAHLYSRIFVVLDALDECQTFDGCRTEFLKHMFDFQAKFGANIFATSRSVPDITESFKGKPSLEIQASESDVVEYICGHMFRLPDFVENSLELQKEIQIGISQSVQGMFLLAQLYLDSLIGKRSPMGIRTALKALPSGSNAYDYAYDNAMERIEGQSKDQKTLAIQALSWITCARTVLSTTELQHALAVEVGESELDEDNLSSIEDIISVCAGLVTIDEESNIVRLVHHTTQDYFEGRQSSWFPNSEAEITQICATYLLFNIFESGPCPTDDAFEERLQVNPLYQYAASNWGHHARKTSPIGEEVIRFLNSDSSMSSAIQSTFAYRRSYGYFGDRTYSNEFPRRVTALHLAAHFGITGAVNFLLEQSDIEANDGAGWSPLFRAISNENEDFVRLLIDKGADVNASTNGGLTLIHAIENRNEAIIQLLLERGANPNVKDLIGRSPLVLAAQRGSEAIFQLLLENGASPNARDDVGQPLLVFATVHGDVAMVQLLLDKDADPNARDNDGTSPLISATQKGSEAIVRLLLENGADPNARDNDGTSSLICATKNENEAIIQLLLEKNANLNTRDNAGRSPLIFATREGSEAILQLLLEKGADPNTGEYYRGQSALMHVIEIGNIAIVRLLLDKEADPNARDDAGQSPLIFATLNGIEPIVHLLLDKGADPNRRDDYGNSPLMGAIENGNKAIVQLLLEKGADPNTRYRDGQSLRGRVIQYHSDASVQLSYRTAFDFSYRDR